jgi:hypothetical protein
LQPINCNTPSAFAACMSGSLPQFDNNGNLVGQTTFNTGSANDKMLLVLMYQWPVIGGPLGLTLADPGLSTRLLVSTEVFYKEPCTNSQTNCKAS